MPTSKSNKKTIGITLGDPGGIGPEVTAKALAEPALRRLARFKIIGDAEIFRRVCGKLPSQCTFVDLRSRFPARWKPGKIQMTNGAAALNYLKCAADLIRRREIHALVTAPVSKEAIAQIDPSFVGHTEFLAEAFGVKNAGMMFVAPEMRVMLVTRHISLQQVPRVLDIPLVFETLELTYRALKNLFKIPRPRIALCGINPHAGEGGAIGREEQEILIPVIQRARKQRRRVEGPFPADTLFMAEHARRFDCIVAMYHDQGLIPIKTLYSKQLVNLTVGLPLIRTSPAHGTAFDIAGRNKADPSSMIEAVKLAAALKI